MRIHETRRDQQARGVDLTMAPADVLAYRHHPLADDGYVSPPRRTPAPVDQGAPSDNQISGHCTIAVKS
jgi:hypothetical protein